MELEREIGLGRERQTRPDWRRGVIQLLDARDDVRGVYAVADFIDEAFRGSA